ncbi:MAG: T9SS type A sorting domain-containing protein [Salibacteraceae bacterium]|nr:T9SS type A sorting domain-containing protein [Salibacteraceae bacterium]
MKKILALAALFAAIQIQAQENIKAEQRFISERWITDPSKFEDDFMVTVANVEAPFPDGNAAKELAHQRKLEVEARFPRKETSSQNSSRDAGDSLVILRNFPVRFFLNDAPILGGTPSDNTLAISNDGKLLTSFNTQIWGYDLEQDTFLFRDNAKHPSFNQFVQGYSNANIALSFPFDPKLMYHPGLDRFVFIFLTGRDPSNSGAIVSFSSTNNPSDVWYSYFLSGNPLDDNTWTDYPQIAMNDHSLYLSLNQLYPDSSWITGFSETVIWQMDLESGFGGDANLATKLWHGANYEGSKLRYLRPVKNGLGPEGDEMYFVANRPFDLQNDSVFLVKIAGDVYDTTNNTTEVDLMISDLNYGFPPFGKQANGDDLMTNDARALGAVRMQNEIQFVGNTVDPASGKSAIYHGIIEDVNNPTLTANIITHDTRDYGYPNIDFIGKYEESRDVVIFFDHTSVDDFAGNSGVFFNSNRTYGPIKSIKEGESVVDMLTGFDERWGDYSGIQRKFNEDQIVWVAGYYGYGNKRSGIWVSELSAPNTVPTYVTNLTSEPVVKTYPNPTSDFVSIQFKMDQKETVSIEIIDVNGKLVRALYKDVVKQGGNELRFSLLPLDSGIYFVKISTESKIISTEKIIKN